VKRPDLRRGRADNVLPTSWSRYFLGFALPGAFAAFATDDLPDAPVEGAVATQGLVLTDLGVIFVELLFLGIKNLPR
jgi:hypothetical protein